MPRKLTYPTDQAPDKSVRVGGWECHYFDEQHTYFVRSAEEQPWWIDVPSVTGVPTGDKSAAISGWKHKLQKEAFLALCDPDDTESPMFYAESVTEALELLRLQVERIFGHPWRGKKYRPGVAERERDAAAERGTAVHEYLEQLALGRRYSASCILSFLLYEEGDPLVNEKQAIVDWWNEWAVTEVLGSEQCCFSPEFRYAGTYDLLARATPPGGTEQLILFDLKTSNGIYDEQFAQLAGYRVAERERGVEWDDEYVLHLPRGATKVTAHQTKRGKLEDENAFIMARSLLRWRTGR
jgi:hypothetical protein